MTPDIPPFPKRSGEADDRRSIFQYWHSKDVPDEIVNAVATVREKNSDMHHRLYHLGGAEELIRTYFSSRELAAFRSCAVPAMQADYFRYGATLALGGFWVDADMLCVRPLKTLIPADGDGIAVRSPSFGLPTNNSVLLFTRPDHPLPRLLLEVSTANIERRADDGVAFVTGPAVLTGLALIGKKKSFEAARRGLPDRRSERLIDAIAQTVGDPARIARAFEHIRLVPSNTLRTWLRPLPAPRYKRGGQHWLNWQRERGLFKNP